MTIFPSGLSINNRCRLSSLSRPATAPTLPQTSNGKAPPHSGTPHKARISRLSWTLPCQNKNKSTGRVVDELHVWIVWSEITATDATNDTGDKGTYFQVSMGYEFKHTIKPSAIITAADRPDLSGAKLLSGTTRVWIESQGDPLTGGVNKNGIALENPQRPSIQMRSHCRAMPLSFGNFRLSQHERWRWPSGRRRSRSFSDWLVAGNDDAGVGDEITILTRATCENLVGHRHAYSIHRAYGRRQRQYRGMALFSGIHATGNQWQMVPDFRFPWRVHYKLKKEGGKWKNNSGNKATDNAGF